MSETRYGILGATGFLGHHLCATATAKNINHVRGSRQLGVDARNINSLLHWITSNGITHIINAAAECGGIGLNKIHPAALWSSTTQITSAVLEAAHLTNIQKLTMIGTVCSYASSCLAPFKEEYLMHYGMPEYTNAAYGVAKLNGLLGSQAYRREFGLQSIYLLPVNLYGPRDNFDPQSSHVIPALIKKCVEARESGAESIQCWGTGTATREFLYVEDAAEAIVAATEHYNKPDPVNIGSGSEISIRDLVNLIADLTGFSGEIIWDPTQPDGQPRRLLDTSKAKQEFDWSANTQLKDGLRRTIDWYEMTRETQCDCK